MEAILSISMFDFIVVYNLYITRLRNVMQRAATRLGGNEAMIMRLFLWIYWAHLKAQVLHTHNITNPAGSKKNFREQITIVMIL